MTSQKTCITLISTLLLRNKTDEKGQKGLLQTGKTYSGHHNHLMKYLAAKQLIRASPFINYTIKTLIA